MEALLESVPVDDFKRRVTICATDVEDGSWACFNQSNSEFTDLPTLAMASSSLPGDFPPTHFKGHIYMDGGMGPWGFNIDSAVEQCIYELGYDLSNYTNE